MPEINPEVSKIPERFHKPVSEANKIRADKLQAEWDQLFQAHMQGHMTTATYREITSELRRRISDLTGEREFLLR